MLSVVDPTLTPTAAEDPVVKQIGDSVWVVWKARNAVLEFARLAEHRDALSAEVTVTNTAAGAELHWARVNLVSTQGRGALVKAVEEAEPTGDWRPLIERSCRLVAKHVRTGEPAVPLLASPPREEQWLVDQLIARDQLTVLFGDGGSGKSYLGLAIAVSGLLGRPLSARWRVAPLRRALILDWESGHREQAARLWRLTEGLKSTPVDGALLYRAMRRPLIDDIAAVRAEVARQEVDLVVADSLAPACGPEPESASAVVPTLLALRSLATTVLIIAHVSKVAADAKAPARPFGSVFVSNLPRSTIEARRSEPDLSNERSYVLSFYHRKTNEGQPARPSALRFTFAPDGTLTVGPGEPDSGGASLTFQVLEALRRGPKKPGQLAEEVDASPASIKKALQRLENRDVVVKIPGHESGGRGKEQEWALVTNRDRNRDADPFDVPVSEPGGDDVPF